MILTAATAVPVHGIALASSPTPDSLRVYSAETMMTTIMAVRIVGESPVINGIPDDSAWKLAEPITEFWQREPKEGTPATERTEVVILYDEHALYVAARMYSKNPSAIGAAATRRDQLGYAETMIINLDTFFDRKTSYSFGVTAAGVKQDYYHPIDEEIKSREVGFNPVWEAKTAFDSLGWTAEMRIPFSQLRFNERSIQTWGVNLNRYIPSRNEDTYWRLRRNKDTGWASLFGELVGIERVKTSSRIEVLPYTAGSATITGARNPENPFDDGTNVKPRAGTDLKMGLGPNLTLDATINPDFGQVEADPAVVNLTAFETVFAERRPFFVEGNKLLSNTGPVYFYSRRIGAAPHGTLSGSFVDIPMSTAIMGAAKVSGRFASGVSLAALSALTAKEMGHAHDLNSRSQRSTEVEPLTSFNVVRLEQEFGQTVSFAGITLTGVRRFIRSDGTLRSLLPQQALTGGGNWNLRIDRGKYEFSGDIGFSSISGTKEAISRIQGSSARYFQRPDATYAQLDSSRTVISGYTARLMYSKNGGDHWLWYVSGNVESPGFELNDLGRITSVDDIEWSANLRYRETQPSRLFHNYDIGLTINTAWNFEGVRQLLNGVWSARVTWKNFWRTTIEYSYRGRAFSDDLTRGGPMMATGSGSSIAVTASSGVTSRTRLSLTTVYGTDELGGWKYELSGSVAPRPGDQWDFTITPRYTYGVDSRQYVASLSGGRPATYGRRYVFSFIERSSVSLQFRFNYNFHPDVSLELYAEPFAASGRYYDLGELSIPRSRDLLLYGTGGTTATRRSDGSFLITDGEQSFVVPNRDFTIRSFRSNLVFRWEWRLGSTLYLVWQQNAERRERVGEVLTGSSIIDSFSGVKDNTIGLKVSFWLPAD